MRSSRGTPTLGPYAWWLMVDSRPAYAGSTARMADSASTSKVRAKAARFPSGQEDPAMAASVDHCDVSHKGSTSQRSTSDVVGSSNDPHRARSGGTSGARAGGGGRRRPRPPSAVGAHDRAGRPLALPAGRRGDPDDGR